MGGMRVEVGEEDLTTDEGFEGKRGQHVEAKATAEGLAEARRV